MQCMLQVAGEVEECRPLVVAQGSANVSVNALANVHEELEGAGTESRLQLRYLAMAFRSVSLVCVCVYVCVCVV